MELPSYYRYKLACCTASVQFFLILSAVWLRQTCTVNFNKAHENLEDDILKAKTCFGFLVQHREQGRRAQLREALLAEAMQECTFKPKTNAGSNREIIARILQAEGSSLSWDAQSV